MFAKVGTFHPGLDSFYRRDVGKNSLAISLRLKGHCVLSHGTRLMCTCLTLH